MRREEFYRQARAGSVGPLEGVRVVGLTKVWSGPLATCVLADLGADVVDVELPGGRDGQVPPDIPGTSLSWFRETVHRNKRSITMDLREPAGRTSCSCRYPAGGSTGRTPTSRRTTRLSRRPAAGWPSTGCLTAHLSGRRPSWLTSWPGCTARSVPWRHWHTAAVPARDSMSTCP